MTKRSQKDNQRIKDEMRRKRQRTEKPVSTNSSRRRKGRGRVKQVSIEELKEEYSYVLKDLRRIFILALAMFVLLIGANLLYPLVAG